MFRFSARSRRGMRGVHPDLVRVAERALELTTVDFVILDGARTRQRQQMLFDIGATWTLNSRHIPGADGFAKAIDFGAWFEGAIRWEWAFYDRIADAFFAASKELDIPIVWGGQWKQRDGGHIELSRDRYP